MNGEIIAFCCEHSAYAAADGAGRLRLHYSENLRIIQVPCAGRIDVLHILKALERGAARVLVLGCEEGACQNLVGNTLAQERITYAKKLLAETGIDAGCVEYAGVAPNAPYKFVRVVSAFAKK